MTTILSFPCSPSSPFPFSSQFLFSLSQYCSTLPALPYSFLISFHPSLPPPFYLLPSLIFICPKYTNSPTHACFLFKQYNVSPFFPHFSISPSLPPPSLPLSLPSFLPPPSSLPPPSFSQATGPYSWSLLREISTEEAHGRPGHTGEGDTSQNM